MFQQDYLMRMIMQLIEGIQRSMARADGEDKDPAEAADLLESAIGTAVDMDGGVFLSLSPESIAGIMQVTGTDEKLSEYIVHSLALEAQYLSEAGNLELSELRLRQAHAIAAAYGVAFSGEGADARSSMSAYLAANQPAPPAAGTD